MGFPELAVMLVTALTATRQSQYMVAVAPRVPGTPIAPIRRTGGPSIALVRQGRVLALTLAFPSACRT